MYDDEHMGDNVAVVVHFINQPTEHAPGGDLQAATWLHAAADWAAQPQGDALLAVAGADACISVISVVEARVVRLLRGHAREVVDLAACAVRPRLLLSLARDGNLRLWDVPSEACLASIQTDATAIVSHFVPAGAAADAVGVLLLPLGVWAACLSSCYDSAACRRGRLWSDSSWSHTDPCVDGNVWQAFSPDGSCFLTGNLKGRLHSYELCTAAAQPSSSGSGGGAETAEARSSVAEGSRAEVKPQSSSHTDAIDCIVSGAGGGRGCLCCGMWRPAYPGQSALRLRRWSLAWAESLRGPVLSLWGACGCQQCWWPLCMFVLHMRAPPSRTLPMQRFLPSGRLATKSTDGRMFVWGLDRSSGSAAQQLRSLEAAASWKVPSCHGGSSMSNRSSFGSTPEGSYIVAVSELHRAATPGLDMFAAGPCCWSCVVPPLPLRP